MAEGYRAVKYLLIGLIILMPGCASDRYLTAEEDAELRAQCEPHPGHCIAIPMPLWKKIEQLLRMMAGSAI